MLNSNKALHRELPGGANLQLLHCTKYLSLDLHPYVSLFLSAQNLSPIQTSKTDVGPKSALDSCWFVISPLPPHPNHHLKIAITQPTPSTPSLCLSTSIVEGCAYSGQNQQPYSLSPSISHTNNFICSTSHHHLHHHRFFSLSFTLLPLRLFAALIFTNFCLFSVSCHFLLK